jgi:competence protein ComEC
VISIKRPLAVACVFFITGLILALVNISLLSIIVASIVITSIIIAKNSNKELILLLLLSFVFGFFRVKVSNKLLPDNINLNSMRITGIIKHISHTKNYKRMIIKSISFENKNLLINKSIKLQAYISKSDQTIFYVGDEIILEGKLILPEPKRNPGCFDEQKYLSSCGVSYKIYPDKINYLRKYDYLSSYLYKFRNKISEIYDYIFLKENAAVVKSIILGDKDDLDYNIKNLYKLAGIYHILAISGLHISIVALYINFILRFLFNRITSNIILLTILSLYCIMTGNNISTIRALGIFFLLSLSEMLYRERDLLTSLSFVAMCMLIHDPFIILNISFEYSFGSVLGIILFAEPIEYFIDIIYLKINTFVSKQCFQKVSYKKRYDFIKFFLDIIDRLIECKLIKKSFAASLAVSIVTYPITIYYFYYFTPYSILINLIIVPTMSFMLIMSIIVGIIGVVNLQLAKIISIFVVLLIKLYNFCCKIFVSLPLAKILVGAISIYTVLIYSIIVFIWLYIVTNTYNKNHLIKYKKHFALAVIILASINIIYRVIPKTPEVTILDVGQGDCFVINSSNQTYIIDGGGKSNQEIGNNTGANILIPFLDYKAKNNIDAVFITHEDADHIIGIIELLGNKHINQIFMTEQMSKKLQSNELTQQLASHIEKFHIPVSFLSFDDVLSNKNIRFECIYPYKTTHINANNESLVLKTKIKDTDILFTADIEQQAEDDILKHHTNIKANILKLAHHGSKTSSKKEFIKKVDPEIAIVSAGKNNFYKHPSKETLKTLEEQHIPLFNTAKSGAIVIKINNNNAIKIIETVKNDIIES